MLIVDVIVWFVDDNDNVLVINYFNKENEIIVVFLEKMVGFMIVVI